MANEVTPDAPARRMNWDSVSPDVDYTAEPTKPVKKATKKPWDEDLPNVSTTVVLPGDIMARLRWLVPSTKDGVSPRDKRQKQQVMAQSDCFHASPPRLYGSSPPRNNCV